MKQSKQPGPRRARRPRRPSGGRGRSLLQPLIFLLICAALVLGMSVFFRVAKIEVVGNSIYTAEEVVEASGIGTGDNLFFINRFSAASRIFSKLHGSLSPASACILSLYVPVMVCSRAPFISAALCARLRRAFSLFSFMLSLLSCALLLLAKGFLPEGAVGAAD